MFVMEEIQSRIVEFIKKQPPNVRRKYFAFLKVRTNYTPENERAFYSVDFDFDDMRSITLGIADVILDSINADSIITMVKTK